MGGFGEGEDDEEVLDFGIASAHVEDREDAGEGCCATIGMGIQRRGRGTFITGFN